MLVVVALRRGQPLAAEAQRANVEAAARAVAAIAGEHHLVLTHGNGPQVGLLALQNAAYTDVPSYPLDVLDAGSEGTVGYMLEQELGRDLPPGGLATLLTQVGSIDAGHGGDGRRTGSTPEPTGARRP